MRDVILLISISAATIILTIALSLTPLAATPGAIGLVIGTSVLRGTRGTARVRFNALRTAQAAVTGRIDRSPAA